MRHSLVVSSLALIVALAGCQVSTKPRTFISVAPEQAAKVSAADAHGEYRLYASMTGARGFAQPVGNPLATHRLLRGQGVGFRRDAGQLQAVAGDTSQPLEAGSYLWQVRADPNQFDKKGTTVLAITGVAIVLVIAVAAVF